MKDIPNEKNIFFPSVLPHFSPKRRKGRMLLVILFHFSGDFRVNEQQNLLVMHTIWVREHNRVAKRLNVIHPHWHDEKLFDQ